MTHVYFMPGMAANPSIFDGITLPNKECAIHYLSWRIPNQGESLKEYAAETATQIKHPNAILVGVSFGGLLVQEIATQIPVKKVIIISSVKSNQELPKRMLFAKYTNAHKLLPTGLVSNIELLAKYAFGETVPKRLALYEKYLSVRDRAYIDWSIDNLVNWKRVEPAANIVHIHGDKDAVFPIQYVKNAIVVPNGTHAMIVNRKKWFNEHLPQIILA